MTPLLSIHRKIACYSGLHTQILQAQHSHTQLFHTQHCHTQLFHTQHCHTQLFTHNIVTHNSFTRTFDTHNIATHLVTSTCFLCGRCGTYSTGLALVARLGRLVRAWARLLPRLFCVPGVALCDIDLHFACIDLHFAWQAWHSRHWAGSGGALGPAWVCLMALRHMNGVVLGAIHVHFAWQARRSRH